MGVFHFLKIVEMVPNGAEHVNTITLLLNHRLWKTQNWKPSMKKPETPRQTLESVHLLAILPALI